MFASHHFHQQYMRLNPTNPSLSLYHEGSSSSYDFGALELEEAIPLQAVKITDDVIKQPLYDTGRPATTLEMLAAWPIRFQLQQPLGGISKSGEESTGSGSAVNAESHSSRKLWSSNIQEEEEKEVDHLLQPLMQSSSGVEREAQPHAKQNPEKQRRGPGANPDKVLDVKSLKRLAQNREAARRSRLRKKAYVQQLESSRVRLTQLEQDLQRARCQGILLGGGALPNGNVSSGGLIFEMEYARWLEEDHRQIKELRTALHTHLPDHDLKAIMDEYISHYDGLFRDKAGAAKSDALHLITGMWTTPVERCFLWLGGFRPSDLIKIVMVQLDPLTEQQVVGIYGLQQSSLQAEEALSQGLEQLMQSVVDTVADASSSSFSEGTMHYMVTALGKLANLEGFVRQADNLRQRSLHQLLRILTVRQAARCFLLIGEYNARLRALSSLWVSRPLD